MQTLSEGTTRPSYTCLDRAMMAVSRRLLAPPGFKRLAKLRILGRWLKRKRKAIGSGGGDVGVDVKSNLKVDESPINGNSNPDCLDEQTISLQAKSMAVQPGPKSKSKAWEVCRERDGQFGAIREFRSLTDGNTTEREKVEPETQEMSSLPTSGPWNALWTLPRPPGPVTVAVPEPRPVSQTSQWPEVRPQSPLVQPSLAHVVVPRPHIHSHMTQRGHGFHVMEGPKPKPSNIPAAFQKAAPRAPLPLVTSPPPPPPPPPPAPAPPPLRPPMVSQAGSFTPESCQPHCSPKLGPCPQTTEKVYILDALNILKHRNEPDDSAKSLDKSLRWPQLHSAVGYYHGQGARVLIFIPRMGEEQQKSELQKLQNMFGQDCVVLTPAKVSDDNFMFNYTIMMRQKGDQARIVTNDNFKQFPSKEMGLDKITMKYAIAAGTFVPQDL